MSAIIRVAPTFLNIRGSLKIGPVDIKTQSSLVKKKNGNWLLLDSLKLEDTVKQEVDQLTNGGKTLDAILNLHPFHTLSCEWAHNAYPDSALYGTARHHRKLPNLPWKPELLEDPKTHALFSDDLSFAIPDGVDFISENESVHFSSVLATHTESATMHVDDTLMFIPTPKAAEIFSFKEGTVQFHPTLVGALEGRKGAAQDFRAWANKLAADASFVNLCTAHLGTLLGADNTGDSMKQRIEAALTVCEPVLLAHELRYGK